MIDREEDGHPLLTPPQTIMGCHVDSLRMVLWKHVIQKPELSKRMKYFKRNAKNEQNKT